MRSRILCLAAILNLFCASGESATALTTEMAQRAVSQWHPGGIMVTGVQELPQQNAALAAISFSNFRIQQQNYFDPARGMWTMAPHVRAYSGPGAATFTHYTDGRWVLVEISTSEGIDSVQWKDLNITATGVPTGVPNYGSNTGSGTNPQQVDPLEPLRVLLNRNPVIAVIVSAAALVALVFGIIWVGRRNRSRLVATVRAPGIGTATSLTRATTSQPAQIYCGDCGAQNRSSSKFCRKCGAEL